MELMQYANIFPYEAVPPHKKILIYGAGRMGRHYILQMFWTRYAEVVGFVDKNYEKYEFLSVPVYSVETVHKIEFDYIVIALADKPTAIKVREHLINLGISQNKIIVGGKRKAPDQRIMDYSNTNTGTPRYAFERNELSIAFVLSPGLGDHIVMKKLATYLISLAPDCSMDIWSANAEAFVPAIYGDLENVFSSQTMTSEDTYSFLKDEYALSMRCDYIIHIDVLNEAVLSQRAPALYAYVKNLQEKIQHNEIQIFDAAWRSVLMNRARYKRNYVYNAVYHMNEFALPDNHNNHIAIPLKPEYERKFAEMNWGRYVTLNFGNGQQSESAAKQWPYEYFCQLVEMFKKEYPTLSIVQLGRAEARRITGCDRYCLGEKLELVKHVLKNSLLHIDIEGGLVHLATHLGTKCVVIFGPTMATFFGYAQNVNIIPEECNGCAYLYGGGGWVCARGMEKPVCLYATTPDIVMTRIRESCTECLVSAISNHTTNEG